MIDSVPFIRHLGPRVAHVTAASNVAGILSKGLLSAQQLATATATPDISLRSDRRRLRSDWIDATLNHQRPILHGIDAASRVLDGHTAKSWAQQLDQRIFFWPERKGGAFAKSIAHDIPIAILWFDTERLLTERGNDVFLCPINSGNFKQGGAHARRGDWIYVPAAAGLDAFRTNRITRGIKRTPDTVLELSIIGHIPPTKLSAMLLGVDHPQVPASGSW